MVALDSSTLLVVDDDPTVLETYRRVLARLAVRPCFCPSGEAALRTLETEINGGRRVAGGFFDVHMPGMDGVRALARARALDADLLCVAVMGYGERPFDEIGRLFRGHEDDWDFLNKPLVEAEILQKARKMLASWNRRRRQEALLLENLAVIADLEHTVEGLREELGHDTAIVELVTRS